MGIRAVTPLSQFRRAPRRATERERPSVHLFATHRVHLQPSVTALGILDPWRLARARVNMEMRRFPPSPACCTVFSKPLSIQGLSFLAHVQYACPRSPIQVYADASEVRRWREAWDGRYTCPPVRVRCLRSVFRSCSGAGERMTRIGVSARARIHMN